MSERIKVITVEPDMPCLLANRLVGRLILDGLLPRDSKQSAIAYKQHVDAVIESLADEIHLDVVDGTLRRGPYGGA